ncbi:MAG TPA: hypothetical protein PKB06_10445, partial [Actinotalea sp.]|nr:hypothetical protein [Actinotalea sp.]
MRGRRGAATGDGSAHATGNGGRQTGAPATRVLLDPSNVWRIGWVVVGLVTLVLVLSFVLGRAKPLIFTFVMAWF